ncbi:hypothetical protein BDP27DRAFT_1335043 [Rhodocollybia butyracea]|uniref:Prolyl 4-hydroxylase alpha subunit Fe(2+) 2OG dioxygenase domain-containing protein n=1 Tax=Rhodocollybia butyracea TaxID=206335 RepID=A0A9P5PIZ3_9AGAR|nr:hypothetical protein BDP27DRAFT_1335043 [Rhodocollybia butyracea]
MSSQSIPQTIPRVTPAIIQKIREAIGHFSFTSGTCKVPSEFCKLYYCESADSVQAKSLNTANATEGQLASLISVCEAASFGRGTETVLDESYRKALKLDLSQFSTPFDLASTPILRRIQQDLVDIDTTLRRNIRTGPYKLNIHDKGAFFKPRKDTPRAENMFGSLVIVFPTPHEGGDQSWTFDAAQALSNSTPTEPELAFVAFYSDVTHEVLPVTSGARITLTFNLYFEDSTSESALPVIPTVTDQFLTIKGAMTELLAEPRIVDGSIDTICFGLSHSYPVKRDKEPGYDVRELSQFLKGSDSLLFRVCEGLGLSPSLKVFHTGHRGSV